MAFADTGASNLKNNRRIIGSKSRMNDAHLNIGKSGTDSGKSNHKKMSEEELKKFRAELANNRKAENRKTIISLISLIVIAVIVGTLFLMAIK